MLTILPQTITSGNTRITFDTATGAAATVQAGNYYPFGMEQSVAANGTKNDYLYNKKELQAELGEYDYGARFYDPVIGRWNVVDAYAEHPDQIDKSPYAYVWDSPVVHDDPDGNCPICLIFAPELIDAGLAALGITVTAAIVIHHNATLGPPVMSRDQNLQPVPVNQSSIIKVEKGSESNPYGSSTAARKDAMRKEGIPTSQQPSGQKKSVAGNTLTYDVPKKGGGTKKKQVQDQKKDENHRPHWEAENQRQMARLIHLDAQECKMANPNHTIMNRKELLIRQNEGRREIDNYISKLVTILDTDIQKSDFLDLETTDEIKKKFHETFNTSSKVFSKTYNNKELGILDNDIKTIKTQFQDQEAYLITKESEICGAVKIPAIKALNNYKSIIELDRDSVNLISTDYVNYFYLDYYEEYGSFYYQLCVW